MASGGIVVGKPCPAGYRSPPLVLGDAATARRLAGPWWLFALLALAASTLCAVVLVLARMPFLDFGHAFFRRALVLHVDLAVVVWFLAVAAGLWVWAAPAGSALAGRLGGGGFGLAVGGVLAMLAAPVLAHPEPVLANYVPALDSPLFYFGLFAFFSGICLAGLSVLVAWLRGDMPVGRLAPWRRAVLAAAPVFAAAVAVFLLAQRDATAAGALDLRFWGGGHVLQIVHTLMLMGAWLYLGDHAWRQSPASRRGLGGLIALEWLAALADLGLALTFPVDSPAYRRGFTDVMRWTTWPAPVGLMLLLLPGYWRLARQGRLALPDLGVLCSMGLFVLGCLVGATIRGETTAVPAHYHGTVGAVTLAYMLWARACLPDFGIRPAAGRLWRWQALIYGAGIGLLVTGLAWAGRLGAPRKAPQAAALAGDAMHQAAIGLAGVGGLLATVGAGIFVIAVLAALVRRRMVSNGNERQKHGG